ncbi:cytochrome P450 [Mycena amicta]|nr:cytochrome P450 [Mycena amicta]
MFRLNFIQSAFCLVLGCLIYCALRWRVNRTSRPPLPPGPRRLPILGSVLSIPAQHPWVAFARWAKEYQTDVMHLDVLGSSIIVLSSPQAITELLDRRSLVYSDRPPLIMSTELMGWEKSIFFQSYGKRAGRRLLHEQLQPTAAALLRPQQLASAHRLLLDLLETPAQFDEHIRLSSGAFSMSLAYGIDVRQADQAPLVETAARTLAAVVGAATLGTYFVDILPILKYVPTWFPGASFKRFANQVKRDTQSMLERPYEITKNAMADGVAPPSFIRHTLETTSSKEMCKDTEDLIKWSASMIYVGKCVCGILSFFVAMLANPHVMRKAQAELDAVIQPGFLPTFDDESSLPYVSALVLEVLRCYPINPIAMPHFTAQEDVYHGMRIPARSTVMANVWSITRDETYFPEPLEFRPERFLKAGKLDPGVYDPRKLVFGFGRRICPGMQVGYSTVWIVVASVLSCFDISKAADEDGEPPIEFYSGLVSFPAPFKCSIRPRSAETAALIRATIQ